MKVIYHEKYLEDYPTASVECPDRIKVVYENIKDKYDFIVPDPANEEDLELVHSRSHIEKIKQNNLIYEVAILAAGSAILVSELAFKGTPSFGLLRPPGHHASPNSCWGFCFFNNIAIAIEKLRNDKKIKQALILDIDLHFGDGTDNIFKRIPEVTFLNIATQDHREFLEEVKTGIDTAEYDIIGVSAGFDYYEKDWGGVLTTEDYRSIGNIVKDAALDKCDGRRFAILEGGYYLPDLGLNVQAFIDGLK